MEILKAKNLFIKTFLWIFSSNSNVVDVVYYEKLAPVSPWNCSEVESKYGAGF